MNAEPNRMPPCGDRSSSGSTQLVIDSEHRLRSENLPWDIDVWYSSVKALTFPTRFMPMTMAEARAILAFHDVSWRHARQELLPTEIDTLKNLEKSIDELIKLFPGHCAFMRLCGRSPKDGEPLDRAAVLDKFQRELQALLREGMPNSGNTKMIAITRASTLKVCSGQEAMSLLLTSERVYSDMLDWVKYGEPEQICLRRWDDDLLLENEFRVFVYNHNITAISQYDHYTYLPGLEGMKNVIRAGIEDLWARSHHMIASASYVVDISYFPNRSPGGEFTVIEYSPFLPCTGASLFNWTSDIDVLEGRQPVEFRIKAECDLHPQLNDLIEINWDMRWEKPFLPYYHWFGDIRPVETIFSSLFTRVASMFSRRDKVSLDDQTEYLFVYGTLKQNFQWNEKYLSTRVGGTYVAAVTTVSCFPLVLGDCGVPYVLGDLTDDVSSKQIVGELWKVTPSCLKNLDDYEGISKGYYSRQIIEVLKVDDNSCSSGEKLMAFIYTLNDSTDSLRSQPRLSEYTLEMHLKLYHATQHIQIKQKNYYKVPSTWGKTQRIFDESSYQTS